MQEVAELRTWNDDAFECARRCLLAAARTSDHETRRALQRAGVKYLYRAHGMRLPGFPTFSAEKTPLTGERPARC